LTPNKRVEVDDTAAAAVDRLVVVGKVAVAGKAAVVGMAVVGTAVVGMAVVGMAAVAGTVVVAGRLVRPAMAPEGEETAVDQVVDQVVES
jgi:hypothetical protein